MLNENAKKWVAALRSGKYQQSKRFLANEHGHCCLGVACEVAIENGVLIPKSTSPGGTLNYDTEMCHLPRKVRDWLGLRDAAGCYIEPCGGVSSLSSINDYGASFADIADLIESEPKNLFN